MSLRIIQPGLQTSVQDRGRFGQMHNGVSVSGAMDKLALQMANALLGNPADAAVLEITLTGPTIEFTQAMTVAICGAPFNLTLNDEPRHINSSFQVQVGDILTFGALQHGCRAYLAVSAEWELPLVMDSYSTHITAGFGGFAGRALQAGDVLRCKHCRLATEHNLAAKFSLYFSGRYVIRCTLGIENAWFSDTQQQAFFNQQWQVSSQFNRMGARLQGDALHTDQLPQMLSAGLLPGSVQVPGSGQPIISAMDGQTLGGYPRIAQVVEADLPLIGQLKGGDRLNFVLVEQAQARELKRSQQQQLAAVCQSLM